MVIEQIPEMTLSPLRVVLDEMAKGTATLGKMAANSGIAEELLRAALEHLVRIGKVASIELGGCAAGGCGSCPLLPIGCHGGVGDLPTRSGPFLTYELA
jgi:hypothetical protein